jgi:hypothetical protein
VSVHERSALVGLDALSATSSVLALAAGGTSRHEQGGPDGLPAVEQRWRRRSPDTSSLWFWRRALRFYAVDRFVGR